MHPTIDELLAFRDQEADPATTSHVEGCPRCLGRLDEILAVTQGLRELGELRPPSDRWPEIRRSILARRRRSAIVRAAGAAALVVLALALGFLVHGHRSSQNLALDTTQQTGSEDEIARVTAELVATSRELELILGQRSRRRRVVTSQRAATIALLEDRLALVDAAIATSTRPREPGPTAGLWLDRVQLLDALVAVSRPPAASSDVQHAVLGY